MTFLAALKSLEESRLSAIWLSEFMVGGFS
jgi:hypothetical protein